MERIGIVTDSTSDLGPERLASLSVEMVPLKVTFGEESFLDWTDLTPAAFYEKLGSSPVLPKTSQPSPADFAAVYARLAGQGFTGIVSVHISSALSGTIESAIMAAAEAPIPVKIVDTRSVNMGTGLAVLAAVDARDAGAGLEATEKAAQDAADSTRIMFALDTLEYLVKGGRAGKAQGLAASLLNIKPVLTINKEGTIEPFKKVKGMKKAIQEMAAQAAEDANGGRIKVGLLHAQAPDLVEELKQALDASGTAYEVAGIVSVGAVIGTHAGPRAIGVAYHPVP